MKTIYLEIPDIPHGHGLSFRRGLADGLLVVATNEMLPHPTHAASYQRGKTVGQALLAQIAKLVKD